MAIKNGIWNALANAAITLTGVIGSILVVRSLNRDQYGTLSYYLWLASIFFFLGTLALPNAITKITSELNGNGREEEAHALSRWVRCCLLAINLLLAVSLALWASRAAEPEKSYLLIIAFVLVPNALMAVLRSTFWGREQYRPVSVTMMIGSLVQLLFIALGYLFNWGVTGFLAALVSISVVQAVALAILLRSSDRSPRTTNKSFSLPERALLRRYFAFALPATLVLCTELVVWQRSEIFFLERLSTLDQVGFYNLGYTIFGSLLTLGWALVHGFYPAISRNYGAGAWSRIGQQLHQGLILAALFAVPLTFGGWAILQNLTLLLYTPKMLPMVPVAQVLLVGILPGVIVGMLTLTVNSIGGIWIQVRAGLVMLVVSISLDLVLVPRLGAMGAALASTLTQVSYALLLTIILRVRYNLGLPLRKIGSILFVGAPTTFLVPVLAQNWFSGVVGLALAICLAAAMYTAVIHSLGYLQLLIMSTTGHENFASIGKP